jgi:hypothetical protein
MDAELTITKNVVDGRMHVMLAGRIDERAQFGAFDAAGQASVVFDFSGITLVNSLGIQAWGRFMKGLPPALKIGFHRCPLRIVNQINLFPGFLGGRKVVFISFYAPYRCSGCNASESVLLKAKDCLVAKGGAKAYGAPARACHKCSKPMEFAAIEEKYFMFLNRGAGA